MQGAFVGARFAWAASKGVVGVLPLLDFAARLADFGKGEQVSRIVAEVLGFAVAAFAPDGVAQWGMGVVGAVVFANTVAGDSSPIRPAGTFPRYGGGRHHRLPEGYCQSGRRQRFRCGRCVDVSQWWIIKEQFQVASEL